MMMMMIIIIIIIIIIITIIIIIIVIIIINNLIELGDFSAGSTTGANTLHEAIIYRKPINFLKLSQAYVSLIIQIQTYSYALVLKYF